jgi:hypothetical protein
VTIDPNDPFAAFDNDLDKPAHAGFYDRVGDATPAKADSRPTYPCERCAGSGEFRGYSGRVLGPCHACKGKGSFLQPREYRVAARAKAGARKAARIEAEQGDFEALHPGLIEALRGAAKWSEFAASLVEAFGKYGNLTDNQTAAAERLRAKLDTRKAERAVEREASKVEVDLAGIVNLFATARKTGLKAPRYLAEGVSLSLAADHGKNPGAIYVKGIEDGEYYGKVLGGVFSPVRATPDSVRDALKVIAANPKDAAVRYGRLTGRCSCCGRKLTDPVSVANGIGPICEAGWGL